MGRKVIRQMGALTSTVIWYRFSLSRWENRQPDNHPQKDTVALTDYFFDQTYGMNGSNNILLSFDRGKVRDKKGYRDKCK